MREFVCLQPIDHDQRHYAIGDPIVLDETASAVLLAERAITVAEIAAAQIGDVVRGSDYLPVLIRVSPSLTVPQAEIVERALSASGLDRASWNGLSDDERELQIVAALELYRRAQVDAVLSEPGLGQIIAAAEGDRVAADNVALAPEAPIAPVEPIVPAAMNDPVATVATDAVDVVDASSSDAPAGKSRRGS